MNKRMKLLILADVLIISSFGLIAPIFAVFIKEDLIGGNLVTAGLAVTIFWVVKSTAQIPLSKYLIDKHRHKTRLLMAGTLLIILVPFIYLTAKHVNTIFFAQVIYGFGTALAYPSWFSLFTTYMDKRHKGFNFSLWSSGVGFGTALAAFMGAKVADVFGFRSLFFFVGGLALIGLMIIIALDKIEIKDIRKKERLRKMRELQVKKKRKAFEKGKRKKQREKKG